MINSLVTRVDASSNDNKPYRLVVKSVIPVRAADFVDTRRHYVQEWHDFCKKEELDFDKMKSYKKTIEAITPSRYAGVPTAKLDSEDEEIVEELFVDVLGQRPPSDGKNKRLKRTKK